MFANLYSFGLWGSTDQKNPWLTLCQMCSSNQNIISGDRRRIICPSCLVLFWLCCCRLHESISTFFCVVISSGKPLQYCNKSQHGRPVSSFMYLCSHGRMDCYWLSRAVWEPSYFNVLCCKVPQTALGPTQTECRFSSGFLNTAEHTTDENWR